MTESSSGRDKIPPAKREKRLKHDHFECQTCGEAGPRAGGTATLHVHHKDPDPPNRDRHDLRNLVTLCDDCHWWVHNRPTGEELPIDFSLPDRRVLLPHDYIILGVLHRNGPLSTTQVHERIGLSLSAQTVRERLWILAGLDYEVQSRSTPLVAKDAVSGNWGLLDQVTLPERGRIPSDTRTFMQRIRDEFVRQAVARGCDRQTIADVFGVVERTIWYRQRRAQAYAFPLGALLDGEVPTENQHRGSTTEQRSPCRASTPGETPSDFDHTPPNSDTPDLGEPDEVWGATTETANEDFETLLDKLAGQSH